MRKLTPEQQKKIVDYWKTILKQNLQNRQELDTVKIPEYWARHSGDYSSKPDKTHPWSGCSDSHIPAVAWVCRATEARFGSGVNNLDKYVAITATKSKDIEAAQRVQNYINYCFKEKLDADKVLADSAQNDIVEGVVINKVIPRKIKKKTKQYKKVFWAENKFTYALSETFDKATKKVFHNLITEEVTKEEFILDWNFVKLQDFGMPMTATGAQTSPWCWERLHLSKQKLKQKAIDYQWQNVEKYETKSENKAGYNEQPEKQEKAEREGTDPTSDITSEYTPYEIWGYFPIDNIDTEEKNIDLKIVEKLCLFVIDIDKDILLYADTTPHPVEFKPYSVSQFYNISGQWIGQGLPNRLAPLNDQLDSFFNMTNDNGVLCNTITLLAKDQRGFDFDKVKIIPGGVIKLPAIDEANIRELRLGNHTLDFKNTIQYIHTLIERMSLITDTTMGMESQGVERPTYRGKVVNLQETAINYSTIVKNFQKLVHDDVVMMLDYLYWYMPESPLKYEVMGEDGKSQEMAITREDLENRKEFKINPFGNAVSVISQQEKADALMLYQLFEQDNTGTVDKSELKKYLVDKVDPKITPKIIRGSQEMQMMMSALQALKQKTMELQLRERNIANRETGVKLTGKDPQKAVDELLNTQNPDIGGGI